MKLSSFNFTLPEELIAKKPARNRDEARLMVIDRKTGQIEHKVFKDVEQYLGEGDSLILNDTKVFPAKLVGKKEKTGAKIQVYLLRELKPEDHQWDALVDPARKIRVGNKLFFGNSDLVAEVSDNTTSRGRTLRFLFEGNTEELFEMFDKLGTTPLPEEIIGRKAVPDDKENYQTVFADKVGAVVAPFAGLHFTKYLLKLIEYNGTRISPLTIHTSLSTLSTIDVEDITKYRINSEYFNIPQETADNINHSIKEKKKICAVGASAMKALESSVSSKYTVNPEEGWTNKFIRPNYDFKVVNALITNFHITKTPLFMNVAAFLGEELIMEAYNLAIKEKYRFFAYGDAMLIL